jgi:phosphoinositide-3-kinase, regulatory subunit 4
LCTRRSAQSHAQGVCHGDIKCENVLVTSWNWVYLSDFASFKPTTLPADNPVRRRARGRAVYLFDCPRAFQTIACPSAHLPRSSARVSVRPEPIRRAAPCPEPQADFSFYFDTGGRRRCYIAPERFYSPGAADGGRYPAAVLRPEMDVFSLGCVFAELFLDGKPLFNLSNVRVAVASAEMSFLECLAAK